MSSRNSFCLPSPGIANFLLLHKIVNEELPPIIANIEIASIRLDFSFVGRYRIHIDIHHCFQCKRHKKI